MGATTELASTSAYTVAELHAMPDDGRRRELIDGMLFVGPAPGWPHHTTSASASRPPGCWTPRVGVASRCWSSTPPAGRP